MTNTGLNSGLPVLLSLLLMTLFLSARMVTALNNQDDSPITISGTLLPGGATTLTITIDDSIAGTHNLQCTLQQAAQVQFDMTSPDYSPVLQLIPSGSTAPRLITGSFSLENTAFLFPIDLPAGFQSVLTLQNAVIKLRPIDGLPPLVDDEIDLLCKFGDDIVPRITAKIPSPTTTDVPYLITLKSNRVELETLPVVGLSGVFDTTNELVDDEIKGFELSIPTTQLTSIRWLLDSTSGIKVTIGETTTLGTYDDEKHIVRFDNAVIPHTPGVEFTIVGIYVTLTDNDQPAINPQITLTLDMLELKPITHVILPPGNGGKATIITTAAVFEQNVVSFEGFLNTGTRSVAGTQFSCALATVSGSIQFQLAEGFTKPLIVIGYEKYEGELSADGQRFTFIDIVIPPSKNLIPFYFLNMAVTKIASQPEPAAPSVSCSFADWDITEVYGIPTPTSAQVPPVIITLGASRQNNVVKIAGVLTSEFGGFDHFTMSCAPTDPETMRLRRPNDGTTPLLNLEPGFDTAGWFDHETNAVQFPSIPLIGTGPSFKFSIKNIFVTLQTGQESVTKPSIKCTIVEAREFTGLIIPSPLTDVNMPMFTSKLDSTGRLVLSGVFGKNAFSESDTKFDLTLNPKPQPLGLKFDFSRKSGKYETILHIGEKSITIAGTANEALDKLSFTIPKQAPAAEGATTIAMEFNQHLFVVVNPDAPGPDPELTPPPPPPPSQPEPITSASVIFTGSSWIDEYTIIIPTSTSATDTFVATFLSEPSAKPTGYVIPSFTLPTTPESALDSLVTVVLTIEPSEIVPDDNDLISNENLDCFAFIIHDPDFQKDSSHPEPTQVIKMTVGGVEMACPLSNHKTITCPNAIKWSQTEPIMISMAETYLIIASSDAKCKREITKPQFGIKIVEFADDAVIGAVDDSPTAQGDWETHDRPVVILPSLKSELNEKEFVLFGAVIDGKNKTHDATGITFQILGDDFVFLVHNPDYDGKNTTPPADLFPTIQIGDGHRSNGTISETKTFLEFPQALFEKANFNNTMAFDNVFILRVNHSKVQSNHHSDDESMMFQLDQFLHQQLNDEPTEVELAVTISQWGIDNAVRSLQHIPTKYDDWVEHEPSNGGLSASEIFLIAMIILVVSALIFVVVFKCILPAFNKKQTFKRTGERQALKPNMRRQEGELTPSSPSEGNEDEAEKPRKKKKKSSRH